MEDNYLFRTLGLTFHKDPTNKDKYLVFTCAKNESEYIVEWVEHYLNLGFDKIILVDNNDLGDNSLYNVLEKYIIENTVEIFDCRGMSAVQVAIYSDFCEIGDYKWCAYFDCDEFLELGVYNDIKTFLSTQDSDCVLVNWLMFGSNGKIYKEDGTVQERFTTPLYPIIYIKENNFFKSIIKGGTHLFDNNWFNGSHLPTMNNSRAIFSLGGYVPYKSTNHSTHPPRYKKLYLKHYYTKSFNEWLIKANRGWPDGTESLKFSNFLCFDDKEKFPIEKRKVNIFSTQEISDEFKWACENFKVITIYSEKSFSYALISFVQLIMSYAKGTTFLLANNEMIDDTMFAMFLEFAYTTGNKAVYCFDENEIRLAENKYAPNAGSRYTITLG